MPLPTSSRFLLIAAFISLATARCIAQNEAGLSIHTFAGVAITGEVGRVYTVQSTSDLTQSNDWRAIGIIQLSNSPELWLDTNQPVTGRRYFRAVEGPTNLVWIRPGTFTMGSTTNEMERADHEGPQTVVTLTRGFFMGRYEVTQAEYLALMGGNPSYFNGGAWGIELKRPVDSITWMAAVAYCETLTEHEKQNGRLPPGWRYRLPTEAEWEFACRAGTTTAFPSGNFLRSGMANFVGSSEYDSAVGTIPNASGTYLRRTVAVGSYAPNAWGLYDMLGNIPEWCQDWWSPNLPGGRVTDPQGPASGGGRVMRGGAWFDVGGECRSAARFEFDPNDPDGSYGNHGLRVVLAQD